MEHPLRRPTVQDYIGWLDGSRWDHMVTLTTAAPCTRERITRLFQDKMIRRLARAAQRPVTWIRVIEESAPGHPHIHALLGGTAELTTGACSAAWPAGQTRVRIVACAEKAIGYVCKGAAREDFDFSMSSRLLLHEGLRVLGARRVA